MLKCFSRDLRVGQTELHLVVLSKFFKDIHCYKKIILISKILMHILQTNIFSIFFFF
jgi:hypothetical protein